MNDDFLTNPDRGCAPKNGVYNLKFTSDHLSDQIAARAKCNACPVRRECLRYAVDNDERWGIWGGVLFASVAERRLAGGRADEPRREPVPAPRRPTAAEKREALETAIRKRWEAGMSDGAIGIVVGLHPGAVSRIRKRLGLAARYGPHGKKLEAVA